MNRFVLSLLAASSLTAPAWAADDPAKIPGANDTRIRTVDYSEKIVTRATSTNKVPLTFTYGDLERPTMISGLKVIDLTPKENVDPKVAAQAIQSAQEACPDSGCWFADRHANQLTLQPSNHDDGSMLFVTTEKPDDNGPALCNVPGTQGPQRCVRHHYPYELRTRDGVMTDDGKGNKVDGDAYFAITYTYSVEDKARQKAIQQAAWQAAHKDDQLAAQKAKVQDKLTLATFGGQRNYQWTYGKDSPGCQALAPERISDNGQFTVLYFPSTKPVSIPNKYDPKEKPSEIRLDWHAEKAPDSGDLMVIHSVPDQFVLRRGEKDVCLFVRSVAAARPEIPFTGTSSPEVWRETKK